jgi:hypothetical protein
MATVMIDPQDVADLTTLTTIYAFLVSAQDLSHLTHEAQLRADLDALVLRVDGLVSDLGERMGMGDQIDGEPRG